MPLRKTYVRIALDLGFARISRDVLARALLREPPRGERLARAVPEDGSRWPRAGRAAYVWSVPGSIRSPSAAPTARADPGLELISAESGAQRERLRRRRLADRPTCTLAPSTSSVRGRRSLERRLFDPIPVSPGSGVPCIHASAISVVAACAVSSARERVVFDPHRMHCPDGAPERAATLARAARWAIRSLPVSPRAARCRAGSKGWSLVRASDCAGSSDATSRRAPMATEPSAFTPGVRRGR